jgi:hypothetical protein
MEYNMMSKLKSRLISSSSAIALALFALSFAFDASQVYAEDLETTSTLSPAAILDTGPEIVEGWICQTYNSVVRTCIRAVRAANDQSTAEVDYSPSIIAGSETDAGAPPAIHSVDAIKVEITQTVTIAIAGEALEDKGEPTITGSISEPAAESPVVLEAKAATPDDEE